MWAIIFLSTLFVFSPVLRNGFVNWDDFANVVDNPHYRGMGWEQLRWMFTTFHLTLYRPVTWMTLGLDYLVWGMDPFGYHLTSLLIHGINGVLYYLIALRLLGLALNNEQFSPQHLRIGAGCAALLFALHPLRVEAVAWVSARNDVVSAAFILLAVLCYLRAARLHKTSSPSYLRWLFATFIIYAVSLLAKASGMTLPFALLILDFYPLRRIQGGPRQWLQPKPFKILLEKIPFLLIAAAAGIAAVLAKQEFHAVHSLQMYGWLIRIAVSLYALAFYLWKTIIPVGLSPLYQLSGQSDPWDWPFLLSGVVVLAITVGVVLLRKRCPAALACWAWYAVFLIPVSGVVSFGPQIVADRYSYLSCLAWPLLAGAGAVYLAKPMRSSGRNTENLAPAIGLFFFLFVGLGVLAWQQSHVWHDSEQLWRRVLAINPATSYAYHNLAAEMQHQGKIEEAIQYYRKAVEIDPKFARAHHNLGDLLAARGDLDLAVKSYRKALEIDPNSVDTYHNLGNTLAKQGKTDEALQDYYRALQINPNEASVHNDLGNLLVERGDLETASRHFRKSADLDPTASAPLFNLGNLMVRLNQLDQATIYFRQALKIDPNYAQAHHNLGRLLAAQGKLDEAIDHFRAAVRVEPRFAEAHQSLIQALAEQGNTEEALRQYRIAREILQSPHTSDTDH